MTKKYEHSILMLHGLGGSPAEMTYLEMYFTSKKYNVCTPLLPRHGTHFTDLKNLTVEELIKTSQNAYDLLKLESEKVTVMGICLGAVLALKLAIDNPNAISNIVPISTTLFYDGWGLPIFKKIFPVLKYTPAYYLYNLSEGEPYGVKNAHTRKWIANEMSPNSKTHYSKIPLKSIFTMMSLIERVKKDLQKINCPTFAIHATEDEVSSLKSVDFMQSLIRPEFFHKLILNDSYHLVTIDQERQLVAKAAQYLLEFGKLPSLNGTSTSDLLNCLRNASVNA